VQGLGSGTVVLGIHIAAPGLAIQPGDAIDQMARARLSTVYMPGYKLTMLPDSVVQRYTLQEGQNCPAVSLYVTVDESTLEIRDTRTQLERVAIAANLRHDQLDTVVSVRWLEEPEFEHAPGAIAPRIGRQTLAFLFRLAKHLKARRELVRGKPENFSRPDYNFRLIGNDGGPPRGDEVVQIGLRQRGAPLDLIVAEAMILANASWGQWMADLGVPAIYRSQASLAPGVKVRMGTKSLPHAGIGVKSYAWSSSPLRRYTDLVNQWQIIACARHGRTAALVAPFKPKDADLFSIISAFDACYAAYNLFQAGMERFWTLKYLQQQGITELDATVIKDVLGGAMVRADSLPLVLPVPSLPSLSRGGRVRVRLGAVDEIALDVQGTVLHPLDQTAAPDSADNLEDLPAEDDEVEAGAITIAVDLAQSPASAEATIVP
jgi:exoribonuclease-2